MTRKKPVPHNPYRTVLGFLALEEREGPTTMDLAQAMATAGIGGLAQAAIVRTLEPEPASRPDWLIEDPQQAEIIPAVELDPAEFDRIVQEAQERAVQQGRRGSTAVRQRSPEQDEARPSPRVSRVTTADADLPTLRLPELLAHSDTS